MPALDPFSGSSRPMIDFDSQPSRPLQFAATLHPIDINSAQTATPNKLPKPRRVKEPIPKVFPSPAYSPSRHASSASLHDYLGDLVINSADGSSKHMEVGSDEWMRAKVAKCVDTAQGSLDIKNLGLTQLSTKIADLRDLVTLPSSFSPAGPAPFRPFASPASPFSGQPDPSPGTQHYSPGSHHLSANARSFSRTISAPASAGPLNSPQLQRRPFDHASSGLAVGGTLLASPTLTDTSETGDPDNIAISRAPLATPSLPILPSASPLGTDGSRKTSWERSKTGAIHLGGPGATTSARDIEIMAGGNLLYSVPTALFEVSNLTFLSLRSNKLTSLPSAIGGLVNLKELNIGLNQITVLPSTILSLSLNRFTAHPNPFLRPPEPTADPTTGVLGRLLSPLVSHNFSPVPRLRTMCINSLISPRPPSNLPPLLDCYTWETPAKGEVHPLLDARRLQAIVPQLSEDDSQRILQALRSASFYFTHRKIDVRRGSSAAMGWTSPKIDPFPRSHRVPPPDDASLNPYYSPCSSPRHFEYDPSSSSTRPTRHLFLHSAEERIEWCAVFDERGLLPIQWLGCSPGCLAFLEHDEEEEWSLDEE